jgi:hypothetical protein
MSNYWVIKWNRNGKHYTNRPRDWTKSLGGPQPFETIGFNEHPVTKHRFTEVKRDDVVFCYQTDLRSIVGLCQVVDKDENPPGTSCVKLKKLKQLDPPCKVEGARYRNMKAFQRGSVLTIYGLTKQQAEILIKACG